MKKWLIIGGVILVLAVIGMIVGEDEEEIKEVPAITVEDNKGEAVEEENEKEHYLAVRSEVDEIIKQYDEAWEKLWKATLDGYPSTLSKTEAITYLEGIKTRYDDLSTKSKELNLSDFHTQFNASISYRNMAAKDLKELIDENKITDKELDEIADIVNQAQIYYDNALKVIDELDKKYK